MYFCGRPCPLQTFTHCMPPPFLWLVSFTWDYLSAVPIVLPVAATCISTLGSATCVYCVWLPHPATHFTPFPAVPSALPAFVHAPVPRTTVPLPHYMPPERAAAYLFCACLCTAITCLPVPQLLPHNIVLLFTALAFLCSVPPGCSQPSVLIISTVLPYPVRLPFFYCSVSHPPHFLPVVFPFVPCFPLPVIRTYRC